MTTSEYILKERVKIQEECKTYNITPMEWITRFAESYHEKNIKKVTFCNNESMQRELTKL